MLKLAVNHEWFGKQTKNTEYSLKIYFSFNKFSQVKFRRHYLISFFLAVPDFAGNLLYMFIVLAEALSLRGHFHWRCEATVLITTTQTSHSSLSTVYTLHWSQWTLFPQNITSESYVHKYVSNTLEKCILNHLSTPTRLSPVTYIQENLANVN